MTVDYLKDKSPEVLKDIRLNLAMRRGSRKRESELISGQFTVQRGRYSRTTGKFYRYYGKALSRYTVEDSQGESDL
ncbi:MAG: hypothetical protein F6K22_33270 [Okeania sp. SIO2F4]|uniref:hypothetical protein n=1 Tax=Okeania sp. SIO2F4 TaxID=2607790 RepID=UPI00142C128C|nr:hypothetical protein [Okeania sp. SIO2F4]NES07239.1 hypothetical protein [Okeania sp. SIO2F4]